MDSREGLVQRRTEAATDLQTMRQPHTWRTYPFLPLRRGREIGVLYHVEGHETTVFCVCLFDLGHRFDCLADLLAEKHYDYPSHEAIVHDGWRID